MIDFTKANSDTLNNAFIRRVKSNNIKEIRQILDDRQTRKKLTKETLSISLIVSLQLGNLDTFNTLFRYFTEDGKKINETIAAKMFNALCSNSSPSRLDNLKEIDKKFNLSTYMMRNDSIIKEEEFLKRFQFLIVFKPSYKTQQQELENEWNEHGFLVAIKNGKKDITDYLLSLNVEIPTKLLECSFIAACNAKHNEIALDIYSQMKGIADSKFINDAVENALGKETKDFASKLILKEQMEKGLVKKEAKEKKNKI